MVPAAFLIVTTRFQASYTYCWPLSSVSVLPLPSYPSAAEPTVLTWFWVLFVRVVVVPLRVLAFQLPTAS